jgi:hypothetical protein
MLTLNPLIVIVPAGVTAMVLFGYARVIMHRRKAQQLKPIPVRVTSRRRPNETATR